MINYITTLTSYSLELYEGIKNLKGCSNIHYKKLNEKYRKSNDRFITQFQLFEVLMNKIDTLIIKMPFANDVSNTQFCDKVDECKTLEYKKSCILENTKKRKRLL